jgi:hypothetical protein
MFADGAEKLVAGPVDVDFQRLIATEAVRGKDVNSYGIGHTVLG